MNPCELALTTKDVAQVVHRADIFGKLVEHLFEPFFRSKAAISDGQKNGTGLGLAIAWRAVKKNGGTISASNVPDGGLRVTIELPLLVVDSPSC